MASLLGFERTTFNAEQAKQRKRSVSAMLSCGFVFLVCCLAMSVAITPLLLILVFMLGSLVQDFVPTPFFGAFESWYQQSLNLIDKGQATAPQLVAFILLLVVPGFAAFGLGSLALKGALRGPGARDLAVAHGGVDADPKQFEERRLMNVVEEIAIAAGIQPPAIVLVETGSPNVAVIGSRSGDSAVLVSRSLLPQMDRETTQGALAGAIAGIANGDLVVLRAMQSIMFSLGLLTACLDVFFIQSQRKTLWGFVKLAFTLPSRRSAAEVVDIEKRLLESTSPELLGEMEHFFSGSETQIWLKSLATFMVLPVLMARVVSFLIFSLTKLFIIGPLLAATWKTRRYHADATAVQLTRNATGFGQALIEFSSGWAPIGDDPWLELTAVAGPDRVMSETKFGDAMTMASTFFPSANKRIGRLKAMGAELDYREYREPSTVATIGIILAVIAPIAGIIATLFALSR